jgi:hypothetical protein
METAFSSRYGTQGITENRPLGSIKHTGLDRKKERWNCQILMIEEIDDLPSWRSI